MWLAIVSVGLSAFAFGFSLANQLNAKSADSGPVRTRTVEQDVVVAGITVAGMDWDDGELVIVCLNDNESEKLKAIGVAMDGGCSIQTSYR